MTVLVALAPPFSPAELRNLTTGVGPAQPAGPSSNTGQKCQVREGLSKPLIDWCTLVLDSDKAIKVLKRMSVKDVVSYVFGTSGAVIAGPLVERTWNFVYERSATLIDETSTVCGRIGISSDGGVCISLSGQGCSHVPSWPYVERIAKDLDGRLTRLDIAVDDVLGQWFDVEHFRELYHEGAFTSNGRPPQSRHVSDEGSNKGCSLYIGQKGHKELCVYEKGKQLGDPESPYVRCELRLYAKRLDLPLDALSEPGKYFGSAYPVLEELILGELERLQVKETMVNASATAMVRFLNTQAGTALGVLWTAALSRGQDYAMSILERYVTRDGLPGRFRNFAQRDLDALIKDQLDDLFPEVS